VLFKALSILREPLLILGLITLASLVKVVSALVIFRIYYLRILESKDFVIIVGRGTRHNASMMVLF
jgi:hypothetical protein